eukprot:6737968-Pyramimonas_sp.AAC.1
MKGVFRRSERGPDCKTLTAHMNQVQQLGQTASRSMSNATVATPSAKTFHGKTSWLSEWSAARARSTSAAAHGILDGQGYNGRTSNTSIMPLPGAL